MIERPSLATFRSLDNDHKFRIALVSRTFTDSYAPGIFSYRSADQKVSESGGYASRRKWGCIAGGIHDPSRVNRWRRLPMGINTAREQAQHRDQNTVCTASGAIRLHLFLDGEGVVFISCASCEIKPDETSDIVVRFR